MGILFLAHNSAIFLSNPNKNLGFGHVEVIWHNWDKSGSNMALVGSWGPRPQKILLVNCYLLRF